MKLWLQFLFLLLTASALAHVPESRCTSELRRAAMRSSSSADFPVCRIAGFQTRSAHDVVPAADLEIGDTAGLETCATLEADAYLLAANQTLAASYRYDPYGNLTYSSGSLAAANVYRFSSKEVHLNSGLYSYGYRFYSPNWQRWLNQDPIGEWGGINLFRFVGNEPVGHSDPDGRWTWPFQMPTWMDPSGEEHAGTPPSEYPESDPNSYNALRDWNTSATGGQRLGDFVNENAQHASKNAAEIGATITPMGGEQAAVKSGKWAWPRLKELPNKCLNLLKKKRVPRFGKEKQLEAFLDATGKVHGPLPNPRELENYHPEDLRSLLEQ